MASRRHVRSGGSRTAFLRPVLALFTLLTAPLLAADNPGSAPTRQELWVPTQQWKTVLKKHPNAVMLTPEQYTALIRDAGKIGAPKPEENMATHAVIESLHFKANATDESAEFIKFDGEMTLRCLTDEWTEVTARMPFRDLASATVDGSVVLGLPEDVRDSKTGATQRKLLVRGKGAHRITMQVLARHDFSGLVLAHRLEFQAVNVPAVLDLQLPHGAIVYSVTSSFTREGDTAHILLNGVGRQGVAWFGGGSSTQGAVQTRAVGTTTITDHSIETAWEFNAMRSLSTAKVAFDVIPHGALVLSVQSEGITSWQQNGDRLEVTMRDLTYAMLVRARVLSVLDLQASTTAQSVALPTLRIVGRNHSNVETRIASIAEGVTLMEYQGGMPSAQGVLTWNPVGDTPKLLLRRAAPRVTVDADTHVTVTRDDVEIERTVLVQTDRPTNELRVTLPKGEEFLSIVSTQGPPMDWKRVDRVIEYTWPQALVGGQPCSLKLQTRKRLNPANQAATASHALSVESLIIPDATKLAGYIALDFDPTWRVGLLAVPGLEERDARLTPVHGKMAWFGLRTYSLGFEVQRRDPVFDADITAYALPRAKTVEIEGQITLNVSDAPLRQFKVVMAKESAGLVRFTSPLVGEQTLDAKTGVWSLSLRKESLGRIPVRFRLSLPASQEASVKSAEEVIKAMLPTLAVNAVRRQRGVWVIEANTDTELTFEAKIMQPLDVLRAPAIEDYQPLHRVVAAYEYATPDASLTVHAVRHGHSELAALIVNEMHLTSVLSHDGSARHEMVLDVHHSGEQFINIVLPPGYLLLTAMADDRPVKPVRGPEGAISIPLPADSSNRPSVPVRLVYEITGDPWSTSGQRHLVPPALPGNISILATDWEVFVPQGYSFKEVNTQMEQEGTGIGAQSYGMEGNSLFLEGGRTAESDEAAEKVLEQMKSIRLPQVTLNSVTIAQAIEYLRVALRNREGPKLPEFILKQGNEPKGARVTLDLKNVPMDEALRYVTELAGMKYVVKPNAILIVPITDCSADMVTRVYKVPASFLNEPRDGVGPGPSDPFAKPSTEPSGPRVTMERTAKEVLTEIGIPFPEGASVKFDRPTRRLAVRNTPANLDLVEAMPGIRLLHRRPQITAEGTGGESDAAVRLTQKLKAIRFPQVTFKGATVDEAVAYLRAKSRELDTDPDPTRRGVNIILKTADTPAGAQITLELKDVPMDEALRYVTELAGMRFKVEPNEVLVEPITESTTEMITRMYKMPPDFLTFSASPDAFSKPGSGTNGPKLMGKRSAKDILIEEGIPFPEGASAVYNPVTSQLVVRNTAPNADMVETLVTSLSTKDATKAGLLTLDLDIPTAGQLLRFHGPLAPTALTLNYVSADRQIVHALVLMLTGALLFLVWGRRWPVLGTLLALLVFTLGIGLITGEWQPLANAALLGWLGALVLARVWKLVRAFETGVMEGRRA